MVESIVLLALIALGIWLFGSIALRVGGLLLLFLGGFGILTGTSEALVLLVLGTVAWLAGHWLYGVKHGGYKSALAAQVLNRMPAIPWTPGAGSSDRIGALDEPCPTTGKVKYQDERSALHAVAENQHRYAQGFADYRLQRPYVCEFCGWWHATSQTERGA